MVWLTPEESETLPTPLEICPPGPVHKELKMIGVSTCGMSRTMQVRLSGVPA